MRRERSVPVLACAQNQGQRVFVCCAGLLAVRNGFRPVCSARTERSRARPGGQQGALPRLKIKKKRTARDDGKTSGPYRAIVRKAWPRNSRKT